MPSLPLKVAKQPLSLAADYRIRVAGNACAGIGSGSHARE